MIRVLFVCMGNICRSPTAHGVFRALVERADLSSKIEIDSAGTHSYHVGATPDPRAQSAAERRGFNLADLRARKVIAADLDQFDYVLVMDRDNYDNVMSICPPEHARKVRLFMEFAERSEEEVPDPYYGARTGFDRVLDMVEEASNGFLEYLRHNHDIVRG